MPRRSSWSSCWPSRPGCRPRPAAPSTSPCSRSGISMPAISPTRPPIRPARRGGARCHHGTGRLARGRDRPGRIGFRRPGMAVTLNGVAQGYITDRVADLLRVRGFDNVLVELGEIRALGRHPDGRPGRPASPIPGPVGRAAGAAAGGYGARDFGRLWHLARSRPPPSPPLRSRHRPQRFPSRRRLGHCHPGNRRGRLVHGTCRLAGVRGTPPLAAFGPATAYLMEPDGQQILLGV